MTELIQAIESGDLKGKRIQDIMGKYNLDL